MKLYVTDQGIGRQDGNRIAIISTHRNLQDVLDQNRLRDLGDLPVLKTCNINEIEYLPLINHNRKFVIVGLNYRAHCEEIGRPVPTNLIFGEVPGTASHSCDGDVLIPKSAPNEIDYEGEIAIIIGKSGRRIPQGSAEAHIAGLTVLQEGSVRDWMRHGKFNVTQGKNFDRSGAIGPWMVTADEFDSYDNLTVTTWVNGEQRQHDTTANLLFSFRYLISYLSTFMGLKPGDIISTGTPTGAGVRFDPPRFLMPGDDVEVEVPGIGLLKNTVIDE